MRTICSFALAVGLVGVAAAQSTILYFPGKTVKDQNIGLKGWGSGTIRETNEAAYEGTVSIGVATRSFFQGGIMNFGSPIDLAAAFGDKSNLLRITLKVANSGMVFPGGGATPGGGNPGAGFGAVGNTGGGAAGGPPRPGGAGGEGVGAGQAGPGGTAPGGSGATESLKNIRLIVGTTDGKKSEVYVPISTSSAGERGWRFVAIPLQGVRGLENTNKIIKSIAISGDAPTTVYVGEIRVINDTTKISGDINPRGAMNLALGDEITFTAYGYGGSSVLKYTWDFNGADGIQVDAEGQVVKRKFRKPGSYTITLTISDAYGLKASYSTSVEIKVNP